MNEQQFTTYMEMIKGKRRALFNEMEQFAAQFKIPIMEQNGIETFLSLLHLQRPEKILEIGSAIGYSAIRMAHALPQSTIVTIERDEERAQQALQFISKSGYAPRIRLITADALEFNEHTLEPIQFDALFIDAAKGQYQRFFEKYSPLVAPGGVIYCDNLLMHGAVFLDDAEIPRRQRTMIRNLKSFTQWVFSQTAFDSTVLPCGDGILVAVKKEHV